MGRTGHVDNSSLGASLAMLGYSGSARLGVALALSLARAQPDRLKIEDLSGLAGSTYASTGRALRLLATAHVARSTRGPRGGWRLSRPANYIKLLDVLGPFCLEGELAGLAAQEGAGGSGSNGGRWL